MDQVGDRYLHYMADFFNFVLRPDNLYDLLYLAMQPFATEECFLLVIPDLPQREGARV